MKNFNKFCLTLAGIMLATTVIAKSALPMLMCPTITGVDTTDPSDCANNGQIVIHAIANPPENFLIYSVTGPEGTWNNTNNFNNLPAGTYYIAVQDVVTGCTVTLDTPVILNGNSAPVISNVTANSPSSCGANDGSITITATGSGSLQYSIDGDDGPWQADPFFPDLGPGDYDVWARNSEGGCGSNYGIVTLEGSNPPVITNVSVTHISDCGANDGRIVITAASGGGGEGGSRSPQFQYSIDGIDGPWFSTGSFSGLAAGNYEVWVRNFDGTCPVYYGIVTITEPEAPITDPSDVVILHSTDCGANNGTIRITLPPNNPTNVEFSITGQNGTWQSSNLFTDLGPGNYDVWVRNNDGTCAVNYGIFAVNEPSPPTLVVLSTNDVSDCNLNDGSISLGGSGGSGTYIYKLDDLPWQDTGTFNNLSPGTYIPYISNADGTCEAVGEAIIIGSPAQPNISSVDATNPSDCGATDGTIIVDASGGTGSLQYSIDGSDGPWSDSNTFNDLSEGSFDVWVRNGNGTCAVQYGTVTLTEPQQAFIDGVSSTDPTECGASDGSISITAGGGSGDLHYSISGLGGPWGPASNFNGLSSGAYDVWVRNSNGTCPLQYGSVNLSGPTPPNIVSVTPSDPSDCGSTDGSISISANGGTGSFQYSIDGSDGPWQSSNLFTGLAEGTYDVWVRNSNGTCPVQHGNVTLTGPEAPITNPSDVVIIHSSDCGANDGTIRITLPVNTTNVEFSIDGINGPWQSSNLFTGLAPGMYDVWVRNDDGSCPVNYGTFQVNEPSPPNISSVDANDPSDCGASDGTITVNASGGSGSLEYSIDGSDGPWQSSNFFSGLAEGNYDVWVRNDNGTCITQHGNVSLNEPNAPFISGFSTTQQSDCGINDATITLNVTGGTGSYQYSINGSGGPWQSSNFFSGLAPGSYNAWARNSNGSCAVEEPNTIVISPMPSPNNINVTPTDPSDCGASDGLISISASGGSTFPVFEYSINGSSGPWQTDNTFNGLGDGTFDVWVRNGDGTCAVQYGNVTLTEPQQAFIVDVSSTDPTECGANDGSISITAGGGSGDLRYSIFGSGGPWGPASNFNGLSSGAYDVWVRNSNGTCPLQYGVVVLSGPIPPNIVSVNTVDPSSCGFFNGSITINANSGTGSFQYSIDGSDGPWQSNNTFTGLGDGTYDVWVRNSNGTCPVQHGNVSLNEPESPVISSVDTVDPDDCGANNGSITINASGGNGSIQYSINGHDGTWQDENTFTGLSAGTYNVWVRNPDTTCPTPYGTVTLSEPDPPVITAVNDSDPSDCGASDGTITITASGGSGSLQYSIDGSDGPWQDSNTFTGLADGDYDIWVRNADSTCPVQYGNVNLKEPSPATITSVTPTNPSDCGAADGAITVNASGGSGSLEYSIDGSNGPWQSANNFNILSSGSYDIWVRNDNGTCPVQYGVVLLTDPEAPIISSVDANNPGDCGANDGSIIITASGGSGELAYTIDGIDGTWQLENTFNGLSSGSYDVWVGNNDGTCLIQYGNVTLTEPTSPTLLVLDTNDASDCGTNDGSISLGGSGGSGSYIYKLDDLPWQDTGAFTNLAPGTYTPYIANADGSCEVIGADIVIGSPAQPNISSVDASDPSDCGASDGTITVNASGGSGSLEYSIDGSDGPWQSSNFFSGLGEGAFDVWVRNDNGTCAVQYGNVTLTEPQQAFIVDVSSTDPTDCNLDNGSISITAGGGSGDLHYSIFGLGGPWGPASNFNGLPSGAYDVWVRNSNGTCPLQYGTVNLSGPTPPNIVSVTPSDPSDCGSTDGSISISANGGTGSFQYSIDGSDGPWQSSNFFSGLAEGTFDVWVRNSNGTCPVQHGNVTLTGPEAPITNPSDVVIIHSSDCGANDGTIRITLPVNTTNVEFSIDGIDGPWQSSNLFTGLAPGTYDVWVRNDDGSCPVNYGTFQVNEPSPPNISSVDSTDPSDCGASDGTITVNASGGSGSLEYSIDGSDGPWQSSNFFSGLSDGAYDVWVRNDNGTCAVQYGNVTISSPSAPSLIVVSANDASDCGIDDGSITLDAVEGSGSYQFKLNDLPWQSSGDFNGLAPGTYTPYVQNDNGSCEVIGADIIIGSPAQPSISSVDSTDPSDCGASDGTITVNASGGSGSLEYSIDGSDGPWQSSNFFSGLSDGAYDVWVRNDNGTCAVQYGNVTISSPSAPSLIVVSANDASDCGIDDGSITLDAVEGSGSYQFKLNDLPWQSSGDFSGLAPGTYTPYVQNDNGSCEVIGADIIIGSPAQPSISSVDSTDPSDCGASDGTITVNASGGSGSLEYSIDGSDGPWQSSNFFSGLGDGSFDVWVRNDNGTCAVQHGNVTISSPSAPSLIVISANDASDCGVDDGSITLDAAEGSGSYQFKLNDLPWQSSGDFSGLAPGTYTPYVQNDNGSCEVIGADIIIGSPAQPSISSVDSTDPSDCGASDGTITVNASGGSGSLEYSIDGSDGPWQSSNFFSGLGDGAFDVWVRNDNGTCAVQHGNVTISSPSAPSLIVVSSNDASDCGVDDGSITLDAVEGSGSYQFKLNDLPWQSGGDFSGLAPGTYTPYVQNDNGSCEVIGADIIIGSPAQPSISSVDSTDPSDCGASDGTITVNASGGSGSLEYSIDGSDGPWQSSNFFSGLGDGAFDVWVRNDNGTCAVQHGNVTISSPSAPSLIVVSAIDASDCGVDDGSITLDAVEGSGSYQFKLNDLPWQSSGDFSGLAPGTYTPYVQNDNGSCEVIGADIIIGSPAQPNIISVDASDPSDCGASDGTITVNASGGSGSLEYSIDGSDGPWQSSNFFSGLGDGAFDVWVRNDNGTCAVQHGNVTISSPSAPSLIVVSANDASDCGVDDGSITLDAVEGSGSYQFKLNDLPWQSSGDFSGLAPGTYTPYVQNDNGSCEVIGADIIIGSPAQPSISSVDSTDPSDCGASDGTITVNASGGSGSLEYSIDGSNGPWQNSNFFSGLGDGAFDVWVRNDNGTCAVQHGNVTISSPSAPSLIVVSANDASDCGVDDGSITLDAVEGSGSYQFKLNDLPWQSSGDFSGLAPGTYTPYVQNDNGSCEVIGADIIIGSPAQPSISSVDSTDPSDCGASDGTITVNASGGSGSLEYSIDGSDGPWQSSNFFSGLGDGAFDVWVRNDNGTCAVQHGNVTISSPSAPSLIVVSTNDASDCGVDDGSITLDAVEGSGSYQFKLNDLPWQSSGDFSGLAPGTYTPYVQNDNGSCEVIGADIIIGSPAQPSISSVDSTDPSDCGASDGTITVNASGGSGSLEYSIDGSDGPWQSSNFFSGLGDGAFDVWVRNDNGTCAVQHGNVAISSPSAPSLIVISANDASDCGVDDGSITLDAAEGSGSYQFKLNDLPWQSSGDFSGLAPGTYTPYVQNDNGSCEVIGADIIIGSPAQPSISSVDSTDPSDCGASDGTITVNASGGSGSLEYSIDGSNGPWQNSNFFSGLGDGAFDVWVRNDNGTCAVQHGNVTISSPSAPSLIVVSANDASDCGVDDGSITLDATEGSGSYQFKLNDLPWQSSGDFSGLAPGTYTPYVQNDNGSCEVIGADIIIGSPAQPSISSVDSTDPSDCGASDGTITVNASGGSGSLEYSIDGSDGPWQSSNFFSGLAEGTFDVWVRNSNGTCPVQHGNVTLTGPEAPITNPSDVVIIHSTDCGVNDGTIRITLPVNNPTNVEFSIDGNGGPWQSSNFFPGLAAGIYDVWVRNDNGSCPVNYGTFEVNEPTPPTISSVDANDPSDCGASDGTITVNTSGGSGSLEYSIDGSDGPWLSSNTFSSLFEGSFEIWVRNDDGTCPVLFGTEILNDPPSPFFVDVIVTDPSDCGANDGGLDILAEGGTGSFQYSIDGSNGPWLNNSSFNGLAAGFYDVWARNADGTCAIPFGIVELTEPPTPEILDVAHENTSDCDIADGEIIIYTPDGVDYEYSLNGLEWQTASVFFNLEAGTYTPMVRNADGTCVTPFEESIVVTAPDAPEITSVMTTEISDCGLNDASIIIDASGGSGPGTLSYTIDGDFWTGEHIFTDLEAGSYEIAVRNDDGSCAVSYAQTIVIDELELPVILNVEINPPSDCDASDAYLVIDANGNSNPLLYSIDGGSSWQDNSIFTGLPAGSYDIAVAYTEEGACQVDETSPVIIEPVPGPEVSVTSSTDVTDCGLSNGSIQLFATGGSGSYQYRLDGSGWQTSTQFENLAPGTYTPWVRNDNGTCETTGDAIVISAPDSPLVTVISSDNPATCTSNDGQITLGGSNGNGSYQYRLNNGLWQNSPSFAGLAAGAYQVAIINEDNTCPTFGEVVTLTAPEAPEVSLSERTNPDDCESTNGSITLQATGGNPSHEFRLNNGAWTSNPVFEELSSGTYIPWVRNGDGSCEIQGEPILIQAPGTPNIGLAQITDATACAANDGSITLSSSSGPDVEFRLDFGTWQTDNTFTGLSVGTYSTWVRFSSSPCILRGPYITISAPDVPQILVLDSAQPEDCESNTGMIRLSAPEGHPFATFRLNNTPWQSNPLFTDLPTGTYTPWIQNEDGSCIVAGTPVVIASENSPSMNSVWAEAASDCSASDGHIRLTASGNGSPFQFRLNNEAWQSSGDFPFLPIGTYTPAVRNSDGSCELSGAPVVITAPGAPDLLIADVEYPSECGLDNGAIRLRSQTNDAQFNLNGGIWVPNGNFSDLAPDAYLPMVQSADGSCQLAGEMVPIIAPEMLQINGGEVTDNSECNSNDGTLTVLANVGPGSYEYQLNGGAWQTSPTFQNLPPGLYTPGLRNLDGSCEVTGDQIEVSAPNAPVLAVEEVVDGTDCDTPNGTITLAASGGTEDFEFQLNDGIWQTSPVFSALPAGEFVPAVRNTNSNCVVFGTPIIITAPNAPVLAVEEVVDGTDCDTPNGTITLAASGGTEDFEFQLNDGIWQTSPVFSALPAGEFVPAVRNANSNCAVFGTPITITAPNAPVLAVEEVVDGTDCDTPNGTITLAASGGTEDFEFQLNDGIWQTSPVFSALPAGEFVPAVRNANSNCVVFGTPITITAPDAPVLAVEEVVDGTDCDTPNGTITLAASGGTEDFEFQLNDGIWQTSPVFSALPAGEFIPAVRNANSNCVVFGMPITITAPNAPVLAVEEVVNGTDCDTPNGTITLAASGGTEDFEFQLNDGIWQTSPVFSALPAGEFVPAVRNANSNCVVFGTPITITAPNAPILAVEEVVDGTDCDTPNGTITLAASGGTEDFEFQLNDGIWQTSSVFSALPAGEFVPAVRNANSNCVVFGTPITITAPDAPVLAVEEVVDGTDCDTPNGTITLAASGGTEDFEFQLNDGIWQTSPVFSALPAGEFVPAVRNANSNCITVGLALIVSAPEAPSLSIGDIVDATDCESADGLIALQASGGSGAYQFRLNDLEWQDSPVFSALPAGNYVPAVRYTNESCEVALTAVTVSAPDAPLLGIAEVINATDCDSDNGAIILEGTGGSGTYQFTVDNETWQDSPYFVQLAVNTYIPGIRNSNGSCLILGAPLNITADNTPVISEIVGTPITDCGLEDGTITLSASGSSGPLQYRLNDLEWQADATFSSLPPGTYLPSVQYPDGSCEVTGEMFTIDAPLGPEYAGSIVADATECDSNDGSISLELSNNSGNYQYRLNELDWQDSALFDQLPEGNYTPYVRNADGTCLVTGDVIPVAAPQGPQLEVLAVVDLSDCDSQNGSVILQGSGGAGPYQYQLNDLGWQDSPNFVQLPAGDYDTAIRFADGSCEEAGATVSVSAPEAPVFSFDEIVVLEASDCDENNGSITLAASGGNGDYQYQLNNMGWQNETTFSGLAPGSYLPSVRNGNQTCEVLAEPIELGGQAALQLVDVASVQPEFCDPLSGQISLTVNYPNPEELEYSIDGGNTWEANNTFSGIGNGTYNLMVRLIDGPCLQSWAEPVELMAEEVAPITLESFVPTIPSSCINNNGEIFIEAEGGSGNYEFSIDNGTTWQATNLFSDLAANYYQVIIRDIAYPCLSSDVIAVELFPNNAPDIEAISTVNPPDCEGEDGQISITLNNPGPNTLYSIDGGESWSENATFSDLAGGEYTIAVQNTANSCLLVYPETIEIIASSFLQVDSVEFVPPTDCGIADGVINIFTPDPNHLFEVSYDLNQWQFTTALTGLNAGEYTLTFRNEDGNCLFNWPDVITLEAPATVVIDDLLTESPSDCELSDGSIAITGPLNPDWEYQLNDEAWTTNTVFNNLPTGEYQLNVRSSEWPNCTYAYPEPVTLLASLNTTDLLLNTQAAEDCINGGLIAIESTTPQNYQYSIDGGDSWSTENTFSTLLPGTYSVVVASLQNQLCQTTLAENFVLDGPPLPQIAGSNLQAADDCEVVNGSLQVIPTGEPNLTYSLDNGQSWNSEGLFTGIEPGEYVLLITDTVTQCASTFTEGLVVGGFAPLSLDSLISTAPACPDEATGSVIIVPTGGQGAYTYEWSNGATESSITALEAGDYDVTVSDTSGCQDTATVNLPAAATLADWGIELSDTLLCQGSELTLVAELPEVADFYWQDGNGNQYNDSILILSEANTISLNVLTLEGCFLQDELELSILEGDYQADFLIPAEGVINEPIVAVDITWPVPNGVEWIYDENTIESIATLPTQQILSFPEPGTYTIGMKADLGECIGYVENEIRIYGSRDSLEQQVPQQFYQLITAFELFPNPNMGQFQIRLFLHSPQAADVWIFHENGELINYQSMEGQDYYMLPYNSLNMAAGVYTAIARVGEEWIYLNFIVL